MTDSSGPQELFDYGRLRAHRTRSQRMAVPGADFLVEHAAAEICSRLAVTNRTFTRALDLFSLSPAMANGVAQTRPGIEIVSIGEDASRDHLPVAPQSFDLAFSAFGLHWSNDLPGTLLQIRRALKPDGLFMAALPGEGTLAELRTALIAAETRLSGGAAMRVDPFVEIRQAGALLQRTGFALPVADVRIADAALQGCWRPGTRPSFHGGNQRAEGKHACLARWHETGIAR